MKDLAAVSRFAALALLLVFLSAVPVVRADEWNQATRFTFSQPVQIPGRVLPAGTYVFQLADGLNHEVVRISNADRTKVIALIQTVRGDQQDWSGKGAITLAESNDSKPEAILAWSYPGQPDGHQFLYPKQVRNELAKDKRDRIVFGD